jgi:hypothetical protein
VCPAAGGSSGAGAAAPCAQTSLVLRTETLVGRLILDRDWLYFVTNGDLYRLAKTGGATGGTFAKAPEVLLRDPVGKARWTVDNMAANATDIYVAAVDDGAQEQQLLRVVRGGREPTVLTRTRTTNDDRGPVTEMVATAHAVYSLVASRCGIELRRYAIEGTSSDGED